MLGPEDLCQNLWYNLKKLLWWAELNPWVRCAFGNFLPCKEKAFALLHRWEVRSSWWLMMVEFDVNDCDKEEAMKFVQLIAAKNDTEMKSTRHEKTFKGFVSQRFNWSRNMRKKNGKKCHQTGKSTNCPAFFSFKLYDCHKEEGIECFALKMKMNYKRPNWILVWASKLESSLQMVAFQNVAMLPFPN